jgi:hypothetical protein
MSEITTQPQRRPLVIFDLNGCLCRTEYDCAADEGDFKVRRKTVFVRPYVHTMLAWYVSWRGWYSHVSLSLTPARQG